MQHASQKVQVIHGGQLLCLQVAEDCLLNVLSKLKLCGKKEWNLLCYFGLQARTLTSFESHICYSSIHHPRITPPKLISKHVVYDGARRPLSSGTTTSGGMDDLM